MKSLCLPEQSFEKKEGSGLGIFPFLERKPKGTGNPERSGLRKIQIVTPEIEIDTEDLKDVPDAQGVLVVYAIGRGDQGNVGRTVQLPVSLR